MPTVLPMILTRDLDRLLAFYGGVLGGQETERMPEEGPAFYLGLRIGDDGDLGLISEASVDTEAPQRILISIEVPDVDALLPQVEAAGGSVRAPANDMPWGQRVAHISDPDGNAVNLVQNP